MCLWFCDHLGDFEGEAVVLAQLFQLSQDALRDAGLALRVQAVHHALHQVDLQNRRQKPSFRSASHETLEVSMAAKPERQLLCSHHRAVDGAVAMQAVSSFVCGAFMPNELLCFGCMLQ